MDYICYVMETATAPHSSTLAWKIPWTEEPGGLIKGFPGGSVVKSLPANAGDTGDVGSIPGLGRSPRGGNDNPLQYSCLGNPIDRGALWAKVHGVAKSWT